MENGWVKTKRASKLLFVTPTTLRKWDKEGKINTIRTPSNIRLYDLQDIYNILGRDQVVVKKQKIAYCRVSSKKQKDDLDRQENLFKSEFPEHILVSDIGSGINPKRKGLQKILEQSMRGEIEEVVVAHRDRLSRAQFELYEFIFKFNKVKLTILDDQKYRSEEQELVDDVLNILHVYSCRQMGKRRYQSCKGKTVSIKETKSHIEKVVRDGSLCLQ